MPQEHWFRIAVAGTTADGRFIKEQWLEEAAKNYDREYYGARIFAEHIRGMDPGGAFKPLGDVLELRTQTDEIKGKDCLCLYGNLKPLPALVELANSGEKIYTSVELEVPFSDTGEAYLVGLAATDSPASIGTHAMSFSKENPNHYFSESLETPLTFTKDERSALAALKEIVQQFRKIFSGEDKGAPMEELKQLLEEIKTRLDDHDTRLQALEGQKEDLKEEVINDVTEEVKKEIEQDIKEAVEEGVEEGVKELEEKVAKVEQEVSKAMEEFRKFTKTDANVQKRPDATGNHGYTLTNY